MSQGNRFASKGDRRAAAREQARVMREEAARKSRRRRVLVQGSVAVAVIAVLTVIGLAIYSNVSSSETSVNPKNMASGGLLLTGPTTAVRTPAIPVGKQSTPSSQTLDGKVAHIQIWLDYQCPHCQDFETTNASQLMTMLAARTATVEIHPVAILDSSSNHDYSERAASAMACIANFAPDDFLKANTALFSNQPDEQTGSGLTDAEILHLFATTGLKSKHLTDCVHANKFRGFVRNVTAQSASATQLKDPTLGGLSTPTVVVNGERYLGDNTDAAQFASFVRTAVTDAGDSGHLTFPPAASRP